MLPSLATLSLGHGGDPPIIQPLSRGGVPTEMKRGRGGKIVLTPEQLEAQKRADIEEARLRAVALAKEVAGEDEASLNYEVPRLIKKRRGGARFHSDKYIIDDVDAARIYLAHFAASRFLDQQLHDFYDSAAAGGYGDVDEGDWEAEGIRPEQSHNYVIANAVAEPLESKWDDVQTNWIAKKFDASDYELVVNLEEDSESFDNMYETHVQEPAQMSETAITEAVLMAYLNNFVDSMINGNYDDDE
jgi:hypothetical protein